MELHGSVSNSITTASLDVLQGQILVSCGITLKVFIGMRDKCS